MSPGTSQVRISWSGWRWLAVGLAAVSVLGSVLASIAGPVSAWPTAVVPFVLAATGVWLASAREGPRVLVGLGTLATWGAVFDLPTLFMLVVLLAVEPVSAQQLPFAVFVLAVRGLPVAAVVAALLALRACGDRYPLGGSGRRRAAAVAIGMAGVASVGAFLLRAGEWSILPVQAGSTVVPHVFGLVAFLTVAAAVWRYDTLSVVPAAIVVTVHALMTLMGAVQGASPLGMPEASGLDVAALLHAGAAAGLVAAAVPLGLLGRRAVGRGAGAV